MEILRKFQCESLLPLILDGTLEIINPGVDASRPWESLSINILPLRRKDKGRVVTVGIEVKRDEDLASEPPVDVAAGEEPNSKFDVEVDFENQGTDTLECFDRVGDLIDWIRMELGK